MKLVRVNYESEICWGVLEGEQVKFLTGDPYDEVKLSGKTAPLAQCKLLVPATPSKIVCLGKNYKDHILEMGTEMPKDMILFIKPTTSLLDPDGVILLPPEHLRQNVQFEGELAYVVKKTAKGVKRGNAKEYILGYTCLNDVTARDVQQADGQWTRGKGMDTFCPVGPILTDEIDPHNANLQTLLNGKVLQDSNTKHFIWDTEELFEFITETITLLPGDIVTTGTPAGVAKMVSGDVVEVRIDGIGTLRNPVK